MRATKSWWYWRAGCPSARGALPCTTGYRAPRQLGEWYFSKSSPFVCIIFTPLAAYLQMGALRIGADFQANLLILIVQILQVQRHDQRGLRLWLRTKPTGLLDKVKVHRGWKCNDGKNMGTLSVTSWIKRNIMSPPWPTTPPPPDGPRWSLELLVPLELWTLLPAVQVRPDVGDDDTFIVRSYSQLSFLTVFGDDFWLACSSTGGTTNGESSAEGSCVVVQLENRQKFGLL